MGYYCKYADVYIDPNVPVKNSVVSHAHADHACAGSINVYCTEGTQAFMQLRFKHKAAKTFFIYNYRTKFKILDVEFEFYSAGHILGSAQILMTYKGVSYLYSGDIKLEEDTTVTPTEIVNADVLITETTFANPKFIHPNPLDEIKRMENIKGPIVIGTYVLGKAQRLNYLLNSILPSKKVYIHFDISPYHKIYERLGGIPFQYQILNKKAIRNGEEAIYLVPPLTYQSYKIFYPYTFAFASGWDSLQGNNLTLKISDHLDWNDLLNYIEQVKAKEVWTIHGNPVLLIEHFKNSDVKFKEL